MAEEKDEHTVISWKAPEFFHYKKGWWWFPILAAITLIITATFIFMHQYFAAIVIVVGGFVIYQLAHQEPEVLPVIFSTRGIKFKDQFYPFDRFKTFWIIDNEQVKKLHLQSIERFSLPIVIPLIKQDIAKVREFLNHYLPETHDAKEDFADWLNRILKI